MAHESCKSQIAVLEMNGQCSKEMDQHRYQNVSIVDFIRAKGDEGGGDNCSYKTSKASVKLPPLTNQHPVFLQAGFPSCHPTVSEHCTAETNPRHDQHDSSL